MKTRDGRYVANAVFEGGGAKGFGLVGALEEMEKTWTWDHVAGTSSGAVVAAFVAMGKDAGEISEIFNQVNLETFKDRSLATTVEKLLRCLFAKKRANWPMVAHARNILSDYGVYSGKTFLEILDRQLNQDRRSKKKLTFKDLRCNKDGPADYKLHVVASDITSNKFLWLPEDIAGFVDEHKWPLSPDDLEVAMAVRMSMSIPAFFEPFRLTDSQDKVHYIVDGGLLSNFPFAQFDEQMKKSNSGEENDIPTFGFNLYEDAEKKEQEEQDRRAHNGSEELPISPASFEHPNEVNNAMDFAKAVWNTMFSSMDKRYVRKEHWARTIAINNLGIATTEFELCPEQKANLRREGNEAAKKFMHSWGTPEHGLSEWKAEFLAKK